MKKRILSLMLAAGLSLALFAGCGAKPEEPKELTKLTVSEVARSVFYAPQYAAVTQGFFAEEGLEVELVTRSGRRQGDDGGARGAGGYRLFRP